jgi:hypothetical protein
LTVEAHAFITFPARPRDAAIGPEQLQITPTLKAAPAGADEALVDVELDVELDVAVDAVLADVDDAAVDELEDFLLLLPHAARASIAISAIETTSARLIVSFLLCTISFLSIRGPVVPASGPTLQRLRTRCQLRLHVFSARLTLDP